MESSRIYTDLALERVRNGVARYGKAALARAAGKGESILRRIDRDGIAMNTRSLRELENAVIALDEQHDEVRPSNRDATMNRKGELEA